MIDYYRLRSESKTSLLRYWQQIDLQADPSDWAWIVFAASREGLTNNPLLDEAIDQGKRWLKSDEPWLTASHLGSVGLLCAVLQRLNDKIVEQIMPRVIDGTTQLWERGLNKFSRLNEPEFLFGIAVGAGGYFPEDLRMQLRSHCELNAQPGNWRRRLLFAAAGAELQANISAFVIQASELEIYDLFPAVWFIERYPGLIIGDAIRRNVWEAFERVKEAIALEPPPDGVSSSLYPASPLDNAMLFEAVLSQTREIDPVILFNNMQHHREVRRVSQNLFVKGEYVNAVFEAAKMLIEIVQHNAGNPTDFSGKVLDGAPLMDKAFLGKTPILKFNALTSQSERDEQQGLGYLAKGVVAAFRNPKGHTPAMGIVLDPYEALEQLATISYLMKRLDSAHT